MKPVKKMMQDIEREVEYTSSMIGRRALDPRVMDAMKQVPRHEFVPAEEQAYAYENGPMPIGYGQTISQPYIVALMTDLLNPEPGHVILEVGTGSGYQAAILSLLVKQVYSTEIVEPLATTARERLQRLGYTNVEVRAGDGYHGWVEHAPFDGIVVTAAAPSVPGPLVEQLKPGGRLVIPVGEPYSYQELKLVEKSEDNEVHTRDVLGVAFVPLTGEHHE
jgi:protein-L-isoaspartate(D-aspartate) O-methyltransferase